MDEEEGDFWTEPTATEEMMDMMLEHVETRYGGTEKYLLGSGLLPEEVDQLKSRLRGKAINPIACGGDKW
jgi:hypothetical protein